MGKRVTWITLLALCALLLFGGAGVTTAKATEEDTIANGIFIGDVAVGGMTAQEAEDAVNAYVRGLDESTVTLIGNDVILEPTVEELGLSEDVDAVVSEAMNYGKTGNLLERYKAQKDLEQEDKVLSLIMKADETTVTAYLEAHADEINRDAVDFGLTRENGAFQIVEGSDGVALNVEESVNRISEYFAMGWNADPSVELVVEVTEPQGSEEELEKVQDVLGKFSTQYTTSSSQSGRNQNIVNGSNLIDGHVVYPGETFSVNEVTSPFTAENGYELAASYENGTTVQSYGGGICQVSTTLYNAVIRAELEIVERAGHSMIVGYVDPSADAAIAGDYKDLKFKNNTDAPIYIEGYAGGGTITFTVYGEETRPSNREISFVSETTGTTEATTEFRATSAAIGTVTKVQSSHTGKTARLWKVVTVDGVEESREVFNTTTYKMSPTIYEVGTASSNAEAVAAINAAIATNDLATIQAAAAQWSDAAVQAAADAAAQTTDTTDTTGTADTSQQTTDAAGTTGTQ